MNDASIACIESLRDFFSASNAMELEDAAVRIAGSVDAVIPPDTDWTAVEYEFNRLFVGPAAVPAPLHASAYCESDRALMGTAALEARRLYHQLGLAVPREGVIPDDHLAFELEAMIVLKSALGADAPPSDDAKALHAWFVHEHLARWLGPFILATRAHASADGVTAMAVDALAAWFDKELNTTAAPLPE
ncbi:chaperone TorD involved in molybdoenzyme TorA maturation [Desulfomicrobium apsheronum]|uniref:Chaperone TorD involved in molybdoenzyme TorA maturation n=1 Tax=Desulfomicrobium apsheronum TaxID=52560 RepID=A0A1I3T2Q2_9BACT|nr:molecular chaperone TorD family protein [Desulfomicrobium apsheronum]SFJ63777.1 chaperone TorD involved in molybdoenzyme TorA maturation [Desulfomicrobium apsheronum]